MDLVLLLLLLILPIACNGIPFITNVSLVPRFPTNFTIIYNSSCDQCLCTALTNASAAVNCFLNNNTCQLFATVPARYRLQPATQAILYFTNGTLPSPSQCCMSNTTLLIQKLQNASSISINFSKPRCLVIDDHGFLVTVQEYESNLSRFDPHNLSLIDTTTFSPETMSIIAYHQGAYFLTTQSNTILIVNSTNLTLINTITTSGFNGVRDIIFQKDGQIMVVASASNQQLFFFNRSAESPRNYSYVSQVTTSFSTPHGLTYVNDSFFYAISWGAKSIYSFATSDNGTWTEKLFLNAQNMSNSTDRWGAHVMIDDCQRRWMSEFGNGVFIFDSEGHHLGTLESTSTGLFDALFVENYVLYLSYQKDGKIVRLDPQIEC